MGIQDRDYMRDAQRVTRASDQRRPGDPRGAHDVFLPGTVHARPASTRRMVVTGVCAAIVTALIILFTQT